VQICVNPRVILVPVGKGVEKLKGKQKLIKLFC